MRSPTRAGGFVWKYSPLLECCNDSLFWHAATTVDTVIPCSSTLVDRPLTLLPFPIDGHGQPLFSPESTFSHTDQVLIDEDSEEAIFAVQNTESPAVKGNGILHTPVSPRLAQFSSFSPFRRSDPSPFFTSTRFDDGILPTPHFSTRLPFPSSLRRSGSFPTRSGPPQQASATPVVRSSPSTLGSHPLSFSSLPSPQFCLSSPHPSPVLASLPIPSPPLPSLPMLLASLHSLLLHPPAPSTKGAFHTKQRWVRAHAMVDQSSQDRRARTGADTQRVAYARALLQVRLGGRTTNSMYCDTNVSRLLARSTFVNYIRCLLSRPFVPACPMPCTCLCERSVCACLPYLLCLNRFEFSDFCVL